MPAARPPSDKGHRVRARFAVCARGWHGLLCAVLLAALGNANAALEKAPGPAAARLESGTPLLRSFRPSDYAADGQNWALAQGTDGTLYVGNNRGVLHFDGQRWRLTAVTNQLAVRSLAVDATGRVYVGAVGEIGYLAPAADGELRYVSLLDQLPQEARGFTDVWNTLIAHEGVVFSSSQRLLLWRDGRFHHWAATQRLGVAQGGAQGIYIVDPERGLLQLRGDLLVPLPGGERFRNRHRFGLLHLPGSTAEQPALLIYSPDHGFARYAQGQVTPWPTEVDEALLADGVQGKSLLRLADGRVVAGTLKGGVYVLQADGRLSARWGKSQGLPDQSVAASLQDRDGGLWLALGNGIAHLSVATPISRLDARHGIDHTVLGLRRHAGQLHVATTQAAFRLEPGAPPRMQPWSPGGPTSGQTWAFLPVGDTLLAAGIFGVHALRDERRTPVLETFNAQALLAPRSRHGWVVVGLGSGLAMLHFDGQRWRDAGRVPGLKDSVRTLVEDVDGRLWAGTYNSGIVRVDLTGLGADGTLGALPVARFGVDQGLPSAVYNLVFAVGGQPAFATSAGIYRFEAATGRFAPDPRYASLFPRPRTVYALHHDPANGLWAYTEDPATGLKETGLIRDDGKGGYQWDARMLRALTGQETFSILADGDGVAWFGMGDGLFRYDGRLARNSAQPFDTRLSRVSGQSGHIHFGGHGLPAPLELPYAENALRFAYAAPSFDGDAALRYQVRLEGSDAEWSDWSAESYKDYNNLFEGRYVFRVRARNLYDTVGREASYAFRVLPPWYRSPWAYAGYALLAAALAWAALRWRLRRLLAQKAALEATVAERTGQIAALGDIGRSVTAQLDLDAALNTLHASLDPLVRVDAVVIDLFYAEEALVERRLWVRDGQRQAWQRHALAEADPLSAACIRERQPVLVDESADLAGGGALDPLAEVGAPRRGARLYVPLLHQARVLGVLGVASRQARSFGPNQRDLLLTLAAYAATAIDNARSHQRLGEQAQALRTANQQLLALDGFKRAMMGMVVHDLKNPLGMVLNALDSPALMSRLSQLRQSARQMLTMVLNILDVQKFEDTTVVLETRPLALSALAAQAVEQVRFLVEQKNLALDLDVPAGLCVRGDGEMLERVLVNLLTNAVKYTPANGNIRLAARADAAGLVKMTVQDSGEGIPAAQLDAVFARFGQYAARDSGQVRSTGLGLSFCKLAVQAHGGQIGVTSTVGVGTSFWFTVPGAALLALAADATPPAPAGVQQKSGPTLTAEDRQRLAPIVAALRPIPLYQYSDLRRVLERADFPSNARIDAWRSALLQAIENDNDALFVALLDSADVGG
jgi:signal transduction histidine kinase